MNKVLKKGMSLLLAASIVISPSISLATQENISSNEPIPYYVNNHKNVSFYNSKESKKVMKEDIAFKYFHENNDEEDTMYIIGEKIIENEKELLDMAANFIDKFIPQRMGDLRIFMFPYDISMVNGYYVDDEPKAIILANDDINTFYHEFGHFVWEFYIEEIQSEDEYEQMVKEELLRGDNPNGVWDYKVTESFAEDFKAYVLYSIKGKSLDELRVEKRTAYPLNDKVFYQLDEMFPEIKRYRKIYYPERERDYVDKLERLESHERDKDSKTFSDWAEDDIEYFYNNSYSIQENNFKKAITREIFAESLVKIYENRTGETIEPIESFKDTDNEYISKCAAIGIVQGVGRGFFLPDKEISRKDMYIMIDRFEKLIKTQIEVDRTIKDRDTSIEEGIAILNRFDFKLKNMKTITDYNWYIEKAKKSL